MKLFNLMKIVFLINFLAVLDNCFPMGQYPTMFDRSGGGIVMINGRVMGGGAGPVIVPSGQIETKAYKLDNAITDVKLSAIGTLIISQVNEGSSDSLEVRADQNVLPFVNPILDEGCLSLDLKDNVVINGNVTLIYILKVKSLESVKISGHGNIKFEEQFRTPKLSVAVSGNGKLEANDILTGKLKLKISGKGNFNINMLNCEELKSEISGNGSMNFNNGSAKNQIFTISGNGHILAAQLKGETANVDISGSGSAHVNIDGRLVVSAPNMDCVINHGRATPIFKRNFFLICGYEWGHYLRCQHVRRQHRIMFC